MYKINKNIKNMKMYAVHILQNVTVHSVCYLLLFVLSISRIVSSYSSVLLLLLCTLDCMLVYKSLSYNCNCIVFLKFGPAFTGSYCQILQYLRKTFRTEDIVTCVNNIFLLFVNVKSRIY